MAQLMGKNLGHQDLIWIVPCAGGADYPVDTPTESIQVTILDQAYVIAVQYHVLNNIIYVLPRAPVFRKQTKQNHTPRAWTTSKAQSSTPRGTSASRRS